MANELHTAAKDAEAGYSKVKKLIEEEKVDVNTLHSEVETRAVDFATQSGSLQTLKYLIETANANVDASSSSEQNLIYWAIQNTSDVLEYIADPKNQFAKKFNDGTTDLHLAAAAGHLERVQEMLLQNPFCINVADIRGHTALYWAAFADHQSIVHAIISQQIFTTLNQDKFDSMLRGAADRAFHLAANCDDDEVDGEIKQYKEAIHCREQIVLKKDIDYHYLVNDYKELGKVYLHQNKITEAVEEYKKSLYFCEKINDQSNNKAKLLSIVRDAFSAIELKQELIQEARAWGFECVDVEPDGDCFFHAVVDQLVMQKNSLYRNLTHMELRGMAVDHITKNQDFYRDFDENIHELVKELQQPGSWADHIAILALSRELNVSIAILNGNGTDPQIFKRAEPCATLYLGYEMGLHYQSLHQRSGWVVSKFIQDEIDYASVDDFQSVTNKRKHDDQNNTETNNNNEDKEKMESPLKVSKLHSLFATTNTLLKPDNKMENLEPPSPY